MAQKLFGPGGVLSIYFQSITFPLATAVIAAAIGSSFQFGFGIGSINVIADDVKNWTVQNYEDRYGERPVDEESWRDWIWGVIVSMFGVGGAVGGLMTSVIAHKVGKRWGLASERRIIPCF